MSPSTVFCGSRRAVGGCRSIRPPDPVTRARGHQGAPAAAMHRQSACRPVAHRSTALDLPVFRFVALRRGPEGSRVYRWPPPGSVPCARQRSLPAPPIVPVVAKAAPVVMGVVPVATGALLVVAEVAPAAARAAPVAAGGTLPRCRRIHPADIWPPTPGYPRVPEPHFSGGFRVAMRHRATAGRAV